MVGGSFIDLGYYPHNTVQGEPPQPESAPTELGSDPKNIKLATWPVGYVQINLNRGFVSYKKETLVLGAVLALGHHAFNYREDGKSV